MLANDVICKKNQFPYPETNVFAIFGSSEQAEHPVLEQMRTLFVVSTQQKLAELEFSVEHPGFIPQLILCLADLRQTVERLRQHRGKQQQGMIGQRIKTSIFGQQPYLVSYFDALGHKHQSIVTACSATQAKKEIPLPAQGIAVPLDLFEELLAQMQAVQSGELEAVYAWDFTPGGEWTKYRIEQDQQRSSQEITEQKSDAAAHWARLEDASKEHWNLSKAD